MHGGIKLPKAASVIKALSTNEINFCLKKFFKREYLGCFACDELPRSFVHPPFGLISNTDTSDKAGCHWVAMYVNKGGVLAYFDSFGFPPLEPFILNFVEKFPKKEINDYCFQGMNEINCGHYCIFFLFMCFKGFSFSDISLLLKKKGSGVDKFVIRFVQELICI